jgi:hypothetical protein
MLALVTKAAAGFLLYGDTTVLNRLSEVIWRVAPEFFAKHIEQAFAVPTSDNLVTVQRWWQQTSFHRTIVPWRGS